MSEKRKISGRKVLQVISTLLLVVITVVAILSASGKQDAARVADMKVHIRNSAHKFISAQDVKNMLLTGRHIELSKTPMGKLDVKAMERILQANPWVENAQVYVDNNRVLQVSVTQRTPVVRLFDQTGSSYYLDANLKAMPLSSGYVPYTSVVTNVPLLRDDSASNVLKGQIVSLVQYIEKDSFWNAQVSQIMLNDDRSFELMPVLGKQRILLGDTAQLDRKFHNLFSFYTKVLNRVGWDRYDTIDLRFAGQVVASPALQWKIPADRAMSNMNWVKTIMDTTANRDKNEKASQVFATMNASLAAANKKQQRLEEQTPPPAQPVVNNVVAAAPQSPNNAAPQTRAPQSPNRQPVTNTNTVNSNNRNTTPPATSVVNAGKTLPKTITKPQATAPTTNRTTAPGATVVNAGKNLPKKITNPSTVNTRKIRNTPTPVSAAAKANTAIKPQAPSNKKNTSYQTTPKKKNNTSTTTQQQRTAPRTSANPQPQRKTTPPKPKPNNNETTPKYIYQGN